MNPSLEVDAHNAVFALAQLYGSLMRRMAEERQLSEVQLRAKIAELEAKLRSVTVEAEALHKEAAGRVQKGGGVVST